MSQDYKNLREESNIKKFINYGKKLNKNSNSNSNPVLINLKSNTGINSINNKNADNNIQNFISFPVNENNISFLTIKDNSINIKRSDISLPKLNKLKIKKPMNSSEKNRNISLCNDVTSRWIQKLSINNNDSYSFFHKNSLITKEEKKDIYSIPNEKIKLKFNDGSLTTTFNKKKVKIPKSFNLLKLNKNQQFKSDKVLLSNNATSNASSSRTIHPLFGFTKIPTLVLSKNSNSHKKLKKIITITPGQKEFKESKERKEKLHLLNNIFKAVGSNTSLNSPGVIPFKKEIKLTSEIFRNNYKNFKESITSKNGDIFKNDIIKGFAYNTSVGNVRSYNEDEICVSKLIFNTDNFNNDNNDDNNKNYCHFFFFFYGHGGKGCASFLKENLHKNIKEFSIVGIKIAVDMAEEKFLTQKAVNEKGRIIDPSGSCGIMLMIQGKKCIVANIGDSRLVIFRNKSISFITADHKPDSIIEKARIELSGGKLYKAETLIPGYQNGMKTNSPWRVMPGRLNVSRTFGDIEAKDENFGGNKTAIIALPDITEIELDENYNFIVIGCDGIFDVLKNEQLLECIQIVLKEKNITCFKNVNMHELCGDFSSMIIKSALAKESFDNISCIVIAINLEPLLPDAQNIK